MSPSMAPGFELGRLPSLDAERARALFPLLIERLMKMDMPEEQATNLFRTLAEPLLNLLLSGTGSEQTRDESWNQWFAFCESFRAAPAARSYQDILDEPDRR